MQTYNYVHKGLHLGAFGTKDLTLDLWDTNRTDGRGVAVLGYKLRHGEHTIFAGEDFCGSPLHAIDSDATLAALLTFLSLRPGDTDPEYFESYTKRQLDFADLCGEELATLAYDLESATIHSLEDLIGSEEYANSQFGASSDDWINDPERMARCDEAAREGCDGSTHGEHIEDMRSCLNSCFDLPELIHNRIDAEIDEVEAWHIEHGTYNQSGS